MIFSFRHRWAARLGIVALAFVAAVAGLASPFFQKIFVDRLLGSELPPHHFEALGNALVWLNGLQPPILVFFAFLFTLLGQSLGLIANYAGLREGVFLQREFSERLYRKTLSVRSDALGSTTVGEVVAMYATDVPGSTAIIDQAIPMGAGIVFPLVFAPIAIHWLSGIPLGITIAVMAVIVVLNVILATRQSRFFFFFKQLAAERTAIVNEWVQNMRLLRILGWVERFEERIFRKRVEETINRVAMVTNGQMMGSFGSSISFVINLTGVASLVYLRPGKVSPGELFALLWIFGVFLARPFRQIPWIFTFSFDGLTSLRRIERYLNRPSDPADARFGEDEDEEKAVLVSASSGFSQHRVIGAQARLGLAESQITDQKTADQKTADQETTDRDPEGRKITDDHRQGHGLFAHAVLGRMATEQPVTKQLAAEPLPAELLATEQLSTEQLSTEQLSTEQLATILPRVNHPPAVAESKALPLEVQGLNLEINGQRLLHDISFSVGAGEFVAIVGEVGSGKSLLVLSLVAETNASFEVFRVGATDFKALDPNARRRHFAFVPQEGFVMSASLRENVAFGYGMTGLRDADVVQSLAIAQFRLDSEQVRDGLDTEIGERGVNLSGGQRQRVSLARAHFFDRPVVLLDDCLSAVDVDTERKLVDELIAGAWSHRTRLLVTHRLSVLEKVDRVLFMEAGRIVESGTFAQLMLRSAKMRDFVASVKRSEAQKREGSPLHSGDQIKTADSMEHDRAADGDLTSASERGGDVESESV